MPDEITPGSTSQEQTAPAVPDMAAVINSAVTSHLKRHEAKFASAIDTALAPILAKLNAPAPEAPPSKAKESPEFSALQQQFKDLQGTLAKAEEARARAESKQREDRAFSDLKGHLAPHIRPDVLDVVASHLFQVQGCVAFDDAGTPLFRTKKSPGFGMPEEEVLMPLKDGVDQYLKSSAAKPFQPAPGSSAANPLPRRTTPDSSATSTPVGSGSDQERAARAMARAAQLATRLNQ